MCQCCRAFTCRPLPRVSASNPDASALMVLMHKHQDASALVLPCWARTLYLAPSSSCPSSRTPSCFPPLRACAILPPCCARAPSISPPPDTHMPHASRMLCTLLLQSTRRSLARWRPCLPHSLHPRNLTIPSSLYNFLHYALAFSSSTLTLSVLSSSSLRAGACRCRGGQRRARRGAATTSSSCCCCSRAAAFPHHIPLLFCFPHR